MNEKRNCRKCGDYILHRQIVNGKIRLFPNRKFCLKCSPYKEHNTKNDDPLRPSKSMSNYKNWTKEQKLLHKARVYKKGVERKEKLIQMAGGCCQKCGYKKNNNALCFHHINPETKLFGLSIGELISKDWEVIVNEFKKCQLLCANCHKELESENSLSCHSSYRYIIKKYYNELNINNHKKHKKILTKNCENKKCLKEFSTTDENSKYCSSECCHFCQRRTERPSQEELIEELKSSSYEAMGRKYGVCGNAIKKWIFRDDAAVVQLIEQ
jgi:predicted Zn-ribbon and HTH transcriptional regulator